MNPSQEMSSSPSIHTYHCLCSQLLLASASAFGERRQRAGESLDKAYIVPLIPADVLTPATDELDEDDIHGAAPEITLREGVERNDASILLNTILDRKPLVVRRTDGFETRYQRRCGRCDLVIGYHLDVAQFDTAKSGRLDKIIYILPGSLKSTSEMTEHKNA